MFEALLLLAMLILTATFAGYYFFILLWSLTRLCMWLCTRLKKL